MIKTLTIKKDWRCFKAGEHFEFNPDINLLVGDQGSGKSSLILLLRRIIEGQYGIDELAKVTADRCETRLFDFEASNPRVQTTCDHIANTLMRFKSHGECVLAIIGYMKEVAIPAAWIMDEPDMALSIRSIYKVIDTLKQTNHQVIAAVHNPFLIQAFPTVLSLEHRRWMPPEEFIGSQA